MNKAAIEARRAYKREWAKAHPESVKKSQEKYWKKKAEEMKAAQEAQALEAAAGE